MARKTAKPSDAAAERRARRDRLLLAALPHVVFDGWTDKAFLAGAGDLGTEASDYRRFFPGGAREALDHFSDWADREMTAGLARQDPGELGELGVRGRVALAVRLRLEALRPHREAVRRALGVLALPPNAALGARCLYRTVDAVWYAIGDRSTDFNFYTKRALLAAVVSSTTLYWLDDASEDGAASWAYLDRRIADVMKIPALGSRLRRFGTRLPDPLGVCRAVRARVR